MGWFYQNITEICFLSFNLKIGLMDFFILILLFKGSTFTREEIRIKSNYLFTASVLTEAYKSSLLSATQHLKTSNAKILSLFIGS